MTPNSVRLETNGSAYPLALARPETPAEIVTSAFAETAQEAMQIVQRRYPIVWGRVLLQARAAGMRPGVFFVHALETGLREIEQSAA